MTCNTHTSILLGILLIIAAHAQSFKENVAVLDLQNRGRLNTGEVKMVTDRINEEVFRYNKFNVVEREQINEILSEQGFQQTGVCEEECLIEVGQLLAVQKMISGSIGKVRNQTFVLNIKIVDVQTGKIKAQVSGTYKCEIDRLLSKHVPELTGRLLSQSGYIAAPVRPLYKNPTFLAVAGGTVVAAGVGIAIIAARSPDKQGQEDAINPPPFPQHPDAGK